MTELKQTLSKIGLMNTFIMKPCNLNVLASVIGSGFQLIALLMFLLTFGALSLIGQIRALRTAGIRLISGENRWGIFLNPLISDLINAIVGITVGIISVVVMKQFISIPLIALGTILTGLMVYNFLLLMISLSFAFLFAVGIKKVHLMQVIKGQIPVRGIISLILIGQLLAVIIVGIGVNRMLIYSQAW